MKRHRADETADEAILKRLTLTNKDGVHRLNADLLKRNGPLVDSNGMFNPVRVRNTGMMAGIVLPDADLDEVTERAVLMNFVKQHIHLFNACMKPETSRIGPRKRKLF